MRNKPGIEQGIKLSMTMEVKPTIFFSYAWGDKNELPGESRENIVNQLYESLLSDHYNPIRDKNNVKYKDFFTDFIAELGKGKCIVVAISEKYLKSTYCMFELYEIARHSNFDKYHFREKIFPIMVEFIDFNNPAIIEHYLTFWESQYKLWSDLIAKRAGQLSVEQMQRYDKVKMIYQNFGKLTDWLADMNTLNPTLLSKDNFEEIKKAIITTVSLDPVPIQPPVGWHEPRPPFGKVPLHWPALLFFSTTLFIAGFLFFGHVSTSEIEMNLSLSEVNFRLFKQQVFTNELRFTSLGVSGLEDIQMPVGEKMITESNDSQSLIHLSVDSLSKNAGSITIDALALPAGMQIGIQAFNTPGQYRMSLTSKGFNLPVHINGSVEIRLPPKPPGNFNLASPKSIHLISGPDQIDFDFSVLVGSKSIFSGRFVTDSLSLSRIDQHFDNNHNLLDTVSTILSGTVLFGSSGRQERRMLTGDLIQFRSSQGEVKTLELQGDHILFSFKGRVSGMTAGKGDNLTSLMPTYLEWLRASHGPVLLSGMALYTLGFIFCGWRWWGHYYKLKKSKV